MVDANGIITTVNVAAYETYPYLISGPNWSYYSGSDSKYTSAKGT